MTRDARRVRRGVVYRSNSFARLTDEDRAVVDLVGFRTHIELRTQAECLRSPSRWASGGARVLASTKPDTAIMLAPIIAMGDGDEADWRARFSDFIARIPNLYADEFSAMFRALADRATPLLISCSAGKDRTGVAVLLLLAVLGVEPEDAISDYLLSDERLSGDPAFIEMLSGTVLEGFGLLPGYARAIMLGVHRDHAQAAIASVVGEYGSVEGYLVGRLGLSDQDIRRMREELTEPVR